MEYLIHTLKYFTVTNQQTNLKKMCSILLNRYAFRENKQYAMLAMNFAPQSLSAAVGNVLLICEFHSNQVLELKGLEKRPLTLLRKDASACKNCLL